MRCFVAALAAAGCLVGAGSGHAAQLYQATLTGFVVPGAYDFDNVLGYGAGFSALDGRAFTATFIYDPTLGNVVNLGPNAEGRRGGLIPFNNVGPIVDAFFSIAGGNTIEFTPEQRSELRNTGAAYQWTLQDRIGGGPGFDDFIITANLASDGHLNDVIPTFAVGGGGLLHLRDAVGFDRGTISLQLSTAALTTYSPAVAVPEPASWALLIVGFGGVGAVLRQRRRTASALA